MQEERAFNNRIIKKKNKSHPEGGKKQAARQRIITQSNITHT